MSQMPSQKMSKKQEEGAKHWEKNYLSPVLPRFFSIFFSRKPAFLLCAYFCWKFFVTFFVRN